MRIIAFIEEQEFIKKILTHLGVYLVRSKVPPDAPPKELRLDCSYSQVPASDEYLHADLNIRSMVISPDSKRGQGSTGTGAPEFPAMFPVPARESGKLVSAWSSALTPGAVKNPQATTCSDDRPLTHMALSSDTSSRRKRVLIRNSVRR